MTDADNGRAWLKPGSAFFDRQDESDDALFYSMPRFVVHIDAATIAALTDSYRQILPPGGAILDLMSSWVSHLPEDVPFARVAGVGMNAEELAGNARLTDWLVQDLNQNPQLSFEPAAFDALICAVSIQYLTRPVEVLRSAANTLKQGGLAAIALSHRCFPTKAIRAWHVLPVRERLEVVKEYFRSAGGYEEAVVLDRSPPGADPLWVVMASRSTDH